MVECLFKVNQDAMTFISKKLKDDFFREKTKTADGRIITAKDVVCRKNGSLIFF